MSFYENIWVDIQSKYNTYSIFEYSNIRESKRQNGYLNTRDSDNSKNRVTRTYETRAKIPFFDYLFNNTINVRKILSRGVSDVA